MSLVSLISSSPLLQRFHASRANVPNKAILWSTPVEIRASAALAGAGAFAASNAVDVSVARHALILVSYTAGAAGGYPVLVPTWSVTGGPAEPAAASWYPFPVTDGVLTETDLAAPVASSPYNGKDFGMCTFQKLSLRIPAEDDTTADIVPIYMPLDAIQFLRFQVAELGATGTPGTLALSIMLGT